MEEIRPNVCTEINGVNWKDRRLIGNIYMGRKVRVKIKGGVSEPEVRGRGVGLPQRDRTVVVTSWRVVLADLSLRPV